MSTKAVTVSIDSEKLARLDGWVRQGRYENRSKAVEAALDLLLRRNARPTLAEALAHPLNQPDTRQWEAAKRDSGAIDAEADAMNEPDQPDASAA